MSLPISSVVNVAIDITTTPKGIEGFGRLLFVTDEVSPTFPLIERIRMYSTLEEVLEDWAATTEVHKSASAFFAQKATQFAVGLANANASAASLQGGTAAPLDELQLITAGGFSISIDGIVHDLTDLDFSLAADEAAIATILQTELAPAVVTFANSSFQIVSGTTGEGSSVTYATADVAGCAAALGLLSTSGAAITPALVPESPLEALAAISDVNQSFFGVDIHKKWRDSTDAEEVATFTAATGRAYFVTTNDNNTILAGQDNIAKRLMEASTVGAIALYSSHPDEYPGSAVAGRAFIVNFEGSNTAITLNLKQLAGITVERLTTSQVNNMKSYSANAVIDIAGNFLFSDSRMSDGTWFDTFHGVSWLKNRIESDVFARMVMQNKPAYTDSGVTILAQAMEYGLRQGVSNGLIAPGNDAQGNYLPLGYEIITQPVSQVSLSDKGNRIYRGLSFKAVGAGAMHQVVITGEFTE